MSQKNIDVVFKALKDIEYPSATDNVTKMKKLSIKLNTTIKYAIRSLPDTESLRTIGGIVDYRVKTKHELYKRYLDRKKRLNNYMSRFIIEKNKKNEENEIIDNFIKEYKKTKKSEILLVKYDYGNKEVIRTVDSKFLSKLNNFLNDLKVSERRDREGSDEDIEIALEEFIVDDFVFSRRKRNSYQNHGGYFDYINDTKLDLSFLQIYNLEQYKQKLIEGIDNCVIHSLRAFNIDEEKLTTLKNIVEKYDNQEKAIINDDFTARHFNKVSEIINKKIKLTKFYHDKNETFIIKNMRIYGDKKLDQINLCLYKNHYMPLIKNNIPSFVIKNYEKINHIEGFEKFTKQNNGKYLTKKNYTKSNTSDIIKMLERTQLFSKHNILTKHINYKQDNITYLGDDDEQNEIKKESKNIKIEKSKKIFYADCETYKTKGNKLKPFLVGVVNNDNDNVYIFECVEEFLKHIVINTSQDNDIIVYFHNAKFDVSVMFSNYYKDNFIIKDNQFYKMTVRYGKRRINIKDSYKHINMRLSKFKSTYKLSVGKKDIYMPYGIYTGKTIKQKTVKIQDLLSHNHNEVDDGEKLLTKEQYEAIKDYCYDNKFRHMDYMRDYLTYDCLTLKYGFLKHRENVFNLCDKLEIDRLDIFDILTTSSLAYKLYEQKGCYNNIYKLNGNRRRFIQESVMGGRVSTQWNKKLLQSDLTDFDACSLYPSAIYRLKKDYGGIPSGRSYKIDNFDEIKNNTYYIVKIRVNNIKNNQQISFFNFTENGKRIYSGDFERFKKANPSREIITDRITIEDLVEFQGLEYEFIEGLYWNKFSSDMSDLTYKLYELRKYYKSLKDENGNITEEGDLLQMTTKLMLNSIYGKTLLKPSTQKIKVISNDKLDNYIIKNHNIINYMVKEDKTTTIYINHNDFNDENSCHVGTMILSMSKRIMNEVMNTANENKIEIYYQDTDSMHLKQCDVEKLEKLYNIKYQRELIGKDMGQFHNDLEAYFGGNMYNCIAEKTVILGKKAYLDVVKIDVNDKDNQYKLSKYSKEEQEKLINMRDDHIRLKGIGSKVFKKNCDNICEIYLDLYNGKEKEFDLAKGAVKFEIRNMNSVVQKNKFIRKVQFK